jgi:hypothetical protein
MRTLTVLSSLLWLGLPWLGLLAACASGRDATDPLGPASERYVRLVLAIGRHDPGYVDAYYGPPAWREEAAKGDPVAVRALLDTARALLAEVRGAPPSERRTFLEAQLVAAEGFLRRLAGERFTLSEEARILYAVDPPVHTVEEFGATLERLDALVPGEGDLHTRIEALRSRFLVPADRLPAVVEACLERTRTRTKEVTALPETERFDVSFVRNKPWTAYNWYKGGYRSLIEINTDLPSELGKVLGTIAHEGYPGHHVQNVLLEEHLVLGKGWRELSVYPLYSPQSLLAEGTANVGLSVLFTEEEQLALVRDLLAPLAGIDGKDVPAYLAVVRAMKPLDYVRGEGARMYFDEGRSEADVLAFLRKYSLLDDARARKALDFAKTYRSYVFNYTVGEDLVRAYIGQGAGRATRFSELLRSPATPRSLEAP